MRRAAAFLVGTVTGFLVAWLTRPLWTSEAYAHSLCSVVVVLQPLEPGREITIDDIAREEVPAGAIDADVVRAANVVELLGSRVRVPKAKGAAVRWSDLPEMVHHK